MKRPILLLITAILFSSVTMLTSCNDDKEDSEKHDNVLVKHNYDVRGHVLNVSVHNTNKEAVTVELFVKYSRGAINGGVPPKLAELYERIKLDAGEKVSKKFHLIGDMPSGIIVQHHVK